MANSRNNPSVKLVERVTERLRPLLRAGDRVVVGLSGGLDSVVLLHILTALKSELGVSLTALHVHHGLSPNADHWLQFAEQLCRSLDVPFDAERVRVETNSPEGPEATARRARYESYVRQDGEWLALAHHRDDQAETMLFNLLRGSGVSGAAAMPWARGLTGNAKLRILRPLLDVSRAEIEAYARDAKLAWVDDESNRDSRYARNFLRHKVFPLLRERFPGCDATLARAANHFAEADALLDALAQIDATSVLRDGRVVVADFAKLEESRARNLLRHIFKHEGVRMPDSVRLAEMVRQIRTAAGDRQLSFDLDDLVLNVFRGEVWLVQPIKLPGVTLGWHGETTFPWGNSSLCFKAVEGKGISQDKLNRAEVTISARRGGERFQPDCRRPRRSLKKLMQERDIAPWQRAALPLLRANDDLVWVPGLGVDCQYQCEPGEPGWLVSWQQGF